MNLYVVEIIVRSGVVDVNVHVVKIFACSGVVDVNVYRRVYH